MLIFSPFSAKMVSIQECIGIMLSSNCCLESLDVSGNALGNDYFSRCVGPALMKNKSLKTLKFSSCGSTDASAILEALCEGNARIAVLDASNNHFGAAFGDGLSRILQVIVNKLLIFKSVIINLCLNLNDFSSVQIKVYY